MECNNDLVKRNLHLLCTAESTESELEALRLLHINLAHVYTSQGDADFIEKQYLTQSKTALEEGNLYSHFEVGKPQQLTNNNYYK